VVEILDLDLVFQIPQKDARNIGGIRGGRKLTRSTMEMYFEL
jgi:hypothetical protein